VKDWSKSSDPHFGKRGEKGVEGKKENLGILPQEKKKRKEKKRLTED